MPDNFTPTNWITTAEAAELTGYKLSHLRYLVREGLVKGQKFGRDWMIHRESVLAYSEKMKELGPAKHDPWRTGSRQKQDKD
jgi:excisionase family DNA binding protein